jgi:hypothetical protein
MARIKLTDIAQSETVGHDALQGVVGGRKAGIVLNVGAQFSAPAQFSSFNAFAAPGINFMDDSEPKLPPPGTGDGGGGPPIPKDPRFGGGIQGFVMGD